MTLPRLQPSQCGTKQPRLESLSLSRKTGKSTSQDKVAAGQGCRKRAQPHALGKRVTAQGDPVTHSVEWPPWGGWVPRMVVQPVLPGGRLARPPWEAVTQGPWS